VTAAARTAAVTAAVTERDHELLFEEIYETERWGKGLGSGSGSDPDYCRGYLEFLEQRIPLGSNVLDLGCGDLRMWGDVPLYRRWNYVGADVSDTAMALAYDREPQASLTKLSASDTGEVLSLIREEKIQFVLLKDVIMHWTDEEIMESLGTLCNQFSGTIITANSWKYWRAPDTPLWPRVLDRHSWAPISPDHPVIRCLNFREVGKYARGRKMILERTGSA
jgi:SAM-dependent methyltransferase